MGTRLKAQVTAQLGARGGLRPGHIHGLLEGRGEHQPRCFSPEPSALAGFLLGLLLLWILLLFFFFKDRRGSTA